VFMHVWISVLGIAPWSLRLPSVVAIGVAAARGVVVLGRQVATLRLGVTAGPAVRDPAPGHLGCDRSPIVRARHPCCAVWVTVVFMLAARGRTTWWILYAVLAAIGVALFVLLSRWSSSRTGSRSSPGGLEPASDPTQSPGGGRRRAATAALTLPFVLVAASAGRPHPPTRVHACEGCPRRSAILQWFHGGPVSGHGPRLSAYFDPPLNWAIGATRARSTEPRVDGSGHLSWPLRRTHMGDHRWWRSPSRGCSFRHWSWWPSRGSALPSTRPAT
jgi:hypothetical protein